MSWQADQTVTEQKPYKYITFTCLTSNASSSAQPLRSSCKSTEPSYVQHVHEEDTVRIWSATFCFCFKSPTACYLSSPETGLRRLFLASHSGSFRSLGFLHIHLWCPVRHQMTEAAPERGQEATCTAWREKKKKSHVKHICNISKVTCFDLRSLITV